jgi:hypothetical protein
MFRIHQPRLKANRKIKIPKSQKLTKMMKSNL